MKRYLIPLALLAFSFAAAAQTMRTVNDTNELVMLNPRSINTNLFVHVMPPLKGSVWTWIAGDTTGPDTNHLDSVLYPGLGRWVWNNIGTNYFETLIVSNLVAGGDSLWTNLGGILQPQNLTLPVMLTNQLQFGPGTTNVISRSGSDGVYTNGASDVKWIVRNGGGASASLEAQGAGTALLTAAGTSPTAGLRAGTDQVGVGAGIFGPATDLSESSGAMDRSWTDNISSNSIVRGPYGPNATNYVRMNAHWSDADQAFVIDIQSLTNNTAGPGFGVIWKTNGVPFGGPSSGANWTAVGATDSSLAGTATIDTLITTNGLYGLPAHAQREHLYFDDADEHNTLTLTNNNMALMRFAGASAGVGGVWMGSAREGDFALMAGVEEEGYPIDVFRAKHTNAVEIAISNDARLAFRIDTNLTVGNTFAMTDRMVVTPLGIGIWDDAALSNRNPLYALDLEKSSRNQLHISYGIADSGLWLASGAASDGGLSVGATYNGSAFVAKGTEAGWLTFGGGGNWYFRDDTGLTPGNTYTPTTRLFIQGSNGYVGIATNAPSEKLEVAGNIKASGSVSASAGTITANANLLQTPELLLGAMGVYRGTLTHAGGNVIVDFSPTNRYWSCTITGNVTFVLTNAAAGKWANILLYNTQATNCTPTFNFVAGSKTNWFGGAPSTLTAGTVGSLSYYPISTDTNATLAAYTETQ